MWSRARVIAGRGFLRERHAGYAEMPAARGLPVIGTTLAIIAAGSAPRLHEYVDSRHKQLGPVFREKLGPTDAVLVADPDEMRRVFAQEGKYPRHHLPEAWLEYNRLYKHKRGLLFMDGEEWFHHRRILNKLLLRSDSWRPMVAPCDQVSADLVERWRHQVGGEVPRLEEQLYRWSVEVILAVLMGDEAYRVHKHLFEDIVVDLTSTVYQIFETSAQLSLTNTKLAILLKIPAWRKFVRVVGSAMNGANTLVSRIIPECKEDEGLLSSMLAGGIQKEGLQRIIADFILAAGDTAAHTMEWALYTLARHTHVQEELYNQLSGLQDPNEVVKCEMLRNTIREVLRLYPVAPFLTRILPNDSIIGGYTVKAGQLVILSHYSSSRDESNFRDASDFCPERWHRDAGGLYTGVSCPYASLPFAMGARSCVGRKVAETQLALTLARIVRTFKLELVDPRPVDVVLRLIAVPSRPVRIQITPR